MEDIISIIQSLMPYIVIALAAIVILFFILIIVLFNSLGKVEKKYRRMMRGVNNKNLEELVSSYLDKIDEANKNSQAALDNCATIEEKMKGCVQKISMVRYKAFEDVGSDLSFSVAILDDNNDGVILTGIYSRNDSTTYAKPIDKGISRYDLSEEEITVLNQAINKVNIH
ncbi:DUF4446 family protein [Clostridium sp. C8-1-8]|uniref:DUF4446 family protein n=1 Tax=Clostridium sp. C8-1-8 TaxID=2698831 RepID=UPI001371228C|nr:DUF4446 family protein [Clostridium sp. C8-1-8]